MLYGIEKSGLQMDRVQNDILNDIYSIAQNKNKARKNFDFRASNETKYYLFAEITK